MYIWINGIVKFLGVHVFEILVNAGFFKL